jgi:hypothetical protein
LVIMAENETEIGHAPAGHSPQTVTIPGTKKKIPKTYAYVGAAVVGVLAVIWYRGRNSGGGAAGNVTDPAGNVCPASAINPATGFCAGSNDDVAASAGTSGEAFGSGGGTFGPGLQGGGGIIGYDQNGNPVYGNTTGNQVDTGPPFTNNGAWSQYAESVLTTLNPIQLTDALGAYISGSPVTPAQRVMIEDAISVAGKPPEIGANGFPPSINVGGGSGGGGTVVVPRLTGSPLGNARDTLAAEGLHFTTTPAQKPGTGYTVTRQTPQAGKRVAAGSAVHLTITADHAGTPGPAKRITMPNVIGMRADDARTRLEKAGFTKIELSQSRKKNVAYKVHASTPKAGSKTSLAATVHLTIQPVTGH